MRTALFLIASILLSLAPGFAGPAFAGDGDVDYSAPYITLDPETGELVTVNPGPQLKSHADPRSESSAQTADADTANVAGESADAGAQGIAGETGSGLHPAVFGVLGAVVLLSAVVFFLRGQGRTRDA